MNKKLKRIFMAFGALLASIATQAQDIKMPSTPRELWVPVRSSVVDQKTMRPLSATVIVTDLSDSTVVIEAKTLYDHWYTDDGEQELEMIGLVLPDFHKTYRIEVSAKGYLTKSVDISCADKYTEQTPLNEREVGLEPFILTKNK